MRNKLNEKNPNTPCKKAYLLTILFIFLWKVEARESMKSSPKSNCSLRTVLLGSANYFLMNSSDMLMKSPVFQNRSCRSLRKNYTLCFLGGMKEAISTTQTSRKLMWTAFKTETLLSDLFSKYYKVPEFLQLHFADQEVHTLHLNHCHHFCHMA